MYIETPKKSISKNQEQVFDFLSELKNFEKLMPNSTDKFELINEDRFLFALKGMPEIVLQRKEQFPHNKIVLGAASEKLPFTLTADILAITDGETQVALSFQGEFNAMMAMMIKQPITNFMDTLLENLAKTLV
ncbi:SRPBCC family protein [Ulvibacterium sp.]|uniref:SRPBCC family protein n=1 Tax=Ulvibacterium sp. TaxID=2665914 RepID=UPI00261FC793|nr:SRPBCC family protein [Ulvibacterium sp.]